jgi:signal transduction histidine kinase
MEHQPRITRPGVILGIATLLGFFSASQAYQAVRLFAEKPTPFLFLLVLNLGYWYAWALLTPIVLFLARRFPFERHRWLKSLAVHLPAVVVITVVHIAAVTAMRMWLVSWMLGEMPRTSWWTQVLRSYFMNFDWEMMTYWAIVGFWHAGAYYRVAQERALRASQLETRLAEAQLQALQRQLHPHFLFNTLNAVSALMHRDVEAADQMLARLSDLLRLALDGRVGQEVALKDELEFLQKYVEIEETRFGDRLSVDYDIDPDALDARVPNLILQPLVENSIRHAIAIRVGPGFIRIGARRAGPRLELTVHDNGPGLPDGPSATAGNGVGLANTRSRLEHLYGPDHELALSSPPGGGLLVTVAIPFRADEPEDPAASAGQFKGVA